MYGALRGRLPARLMALFQIRDCSQANIGQLARFQMLSPVDSGRPSDIHSLVMVQLRKDA